MNDNVRIYHVDEYCEGASHFCFSERKDVVLFEDYEKLREENERLKGELEMEHDDCSNAKKCEVEFHKAHEKELDENVILRKENAKLKCLALHLLREHCFAQGTIISSELEDTDQPIEEDVKMIHKINIRDRWGEYFADAYYKAKQKLMEEK